MTPTTTPIETIPPLRNHTDDHPHSTSNARWGAILAGVAMACAMWIVLYMFGMGVGLMSIDPEGDNSFRAIGIGAGIWSVVAPILSLFVGGLVASRLAPTPNKLNRMIHGGLVWAVSSIASLALVFSLAASVAHGAVSAGGQVAGAMTGMAADAAGSVDTGTFQSLGIDSKDLLGPINQRLRADNKPEVTATQLEAAAKEALSTAVRTGKLDRQMVMTALSTNTALTPRDTEEIAAAIDSKWQTVRDRAEAIKERAKTAALTAAEATGKAMMGLSIALLLGLLAAFGGALLTGNRDRRRRGTADIATIRTSDPVTVPPTSRIV